MRLADRGWSCFGCGGGGEVRVLFSHTVRHQFEAMVDEFRRSAGLKGL
jgi:hypothetical protein